MRSEAIAANVAVAPAVPAVSGVAAARVVAPVADFIAPPVAIVSVADDGKLVRYK